MSKHDGLASGVADAGRASARHPPVPPHGTFTKCTGSQELVWKAKRDFILSQG